MQVTALGVRTACATFTAAILVGCGAQQSGLIIKVVDARTGAPVAGATVAINGVDSSTNQSGLTSTVVRPDSYDVSVQDAPYLPLTTTILVTAGGGSSTRTISLYPRPDGPGGVTPTPEPAPGVTPNPSASGNVPAPVPSATGGVAVFGRVTDATGNLVPNAVILVETAWGVTQGMATSNAQGQYRIAHMPAHQQLHITAVADGYNAVARSFTPASDWRIDFTGQFALKPPADPVPAPGHTGILQVAGTVYDTYGHALDGALVHVESDTTSTAFDRTVIARQGRYQLAVPTGLPLRFTSSMAGYRTTSFQDEVPDGGFGLAYKEDFSGPRALDLLPVEEPGTIGAKMVSVGPKLLN